ncbi:MAG: mannose-6-phosphate isomerase, partial [Paludibacteraceae bacterium]|nr:mannose-6-phosphate isomerase [Paludibacteraceae bacterium]
MSLYPLKFKPILKDKIWGGSRLSSKSKKGNDARIGESWEISGLIGEESVVSEGYLKDNNINELIEVYMTELVGERIYDEFGNEFPLILKLIDAKEDLSIQVHP